METLAALPRDIWERTPPEAQASIGTLEAFGPLRAGSLSELRDGAPSRRRAQPRLGGRGRSFRAAPPHEREAETVVIENKTYHKNLLTRLA